MFKKQRLKLVLLNTAVFFSLFILFSTVVYFYTKFTLYNGVDEAILASKKKIENRLKESAVKFPYLNFRDIQIKENKSGNEIFRSIPSLDPRIIPILRDEKGNILFHSQLSVFYQNNLDNIKPEKIDELYDIKFNQFHFRTLAFSAELNNKTIMIQLLRNTNSEKELLDNLLKIIIIGGIIVFVVSIGAGILLAQRTMIPIVDAWKRQRQFVENASHELRTPLTVIQSQLELILKNPDSNIMANASYLGTALSETRRLSKLTSNLLTLARSDSNTIEIEKKPTNICDLINKIIEPYIEIADLEDKCLKLKCSESLVVNCDEARISQLIIILLDNALKYTNHGDNIDIELKQEETRCSIRVIDTGIGVKEEEKELIFQRFYRGDKSRTRVTGGTGLGLSIAKWIVDSHGGSIKAMPNQPKGTIIKVSLPIE
ncbi:sensor histidine kinase [Clostridium thailandense]|uniref:sensor histidine kinase n=1 Tax=Clostridium thailandense TaxID=2794346 RepID=UPI003989F6BA